MKRHANMQSTRTRVLVGGVVLTFGILGGVLATQGGATATTPDVVKAAITHAFTFLGNDHPTEATYVESTRSAAMTSLADAEMDDARAVYVIQLRGVFTARGAYGPLGSAPPTGTVATIVIDRDTGEELDFGLNNLLTDLSTLGDAQRVEDMGF